MKQLLIVVALLGVSQVVVAQVSGPGVSALQQSGTVTAGNCTKWIAPGVLGDSGGACGGSGAPGGATTQIQYNNGGAFAGNAGLTYTSASQTVTLGTTATNGTITAPTPASGNPGNGITVLGANGVGANQNGGGVTLTGGNADTGAAGTGLGGGITLNAGTNGSGTLPAATPLIVNVDANNSLVAVESFPSAGNNAMQWLFQNLGAGTATEMELSFWNNATDGFIACTPSDAFAVTETGCGLNSAVPALATANQNSPAFGCVTDKDCWITTGNGPNPVIRLNGTAGAASTPHKAVIFWGVPFGLQGSTSGQIIVQAQAAAGSYNFNMPTTAGTAGQLLTSQGGGTTAMTWTSLSSPPAIGNTTAASGAFTTLSSSSTTTFSGLTTGTNADFLCMATGGQVLIQASACTISSLRFKNHVSAFTGDPLAELDKLEVDSFQLNDDHNRDPNATLPQIGLIAENVAKVEPKCAVWENDLETPKSYRSECVTALLVSASQEFHRESKHQFELLYAAFTALLVLVIHNAHLHIKVRELRATH